MQFPYSNSIEVDGQAFDVSTIDRVLRPLITDERLARIESVIDDRTFSVTPVLEGLYDRGNVSAAMRSAEALGFASVHVIDTSEYFKEAKRVTQGAEKWLDVSVYQSTSEGIRALRARGYRIYATSFEDAVPVETIDFTVPAAVVFGNEKDGVSREMLDAADAHIIIPMSGFTQSFNISVAAALLLYHARQDRIHRRGAQGDLSTAQKQSLRAQYFLRAVQNAGRILASAGTGRFTDAPSFGASGSIS